MELIILFGFVAAVMGALGYVLWAVWDERPAGWPQQMLSAASVAGTILLLGGYALVRAMGSLASGGTAD